MLVPDMMPKVQIDTGAIKFILSGADIMCPGLTSAGGRISADLAQGAAVVLKLYLCIDHSPTFE